MENKIEIAPNITQEEMIALYFDQDALIEQPDKVYRLDAKGKRYYYTFDENDKPVFYLSTTSFIHASLPTSPQLIEWIANKGYEESQKYMNERADYGTFLHIELSKLLINKSYDLDGVEEKLAKYIQDNNLKDINFDNWSSDIKKDILAYAAWMIEYDVKPLAVELILVDNDMKIGGAIDLACELTIEEKGFFGEVYKSGANAGQPKESKQSRRVRAIVDTKSGRKGFYESHEIQLEAYRIMWNKKFPEKQVEKIFNWSPKEWRTEPGFNFKDQSNSKNLGKLPYMVEIAKIKDEDNDKSVIICSGKINLKDNNLKSNVEEYTLETLINRRILVDEMMDDSEATTDLKEQLFEELVSEVKTEPEEVKQQTKNIKPSLFD